MAPKVPSKAHFIKSIPAALSVIRCLHTIVVVVSPAYSLRSSGAINDILKSFWTRTPVISCSSWSSASGGGICASFPTTFAVLSTLKGMRSSSVLAGLKILVFKVLSALRERSFDFKRIMLCFSPCTRIYDE